MTAVTQAPGQTVRPTLPPTLAPTIVAGFADASARAADEGRGGSRLWLILLLSGLAVVVLGTVIIALRSSRRKADRRRALMRAQQARNARRADPSAPQGYRGEPGQPFGSTARPAAPLRDGVGRRGAQDGTAENDEDHTVRFDAGTASRRRTDAAAPDDRTASRRRTAPAEDENAIFRRPAQETVSLPRTDAAQAPQPDEGRPVSASTNARRRRTERYHYGDDE